MLEIKPYVKCTHASPSHSQGSLYSSTLPTLLAAVLRHFLDVVPSPGARINAVCLNPKLATKTGLVVLNIKKHA